MEIPKVDLSTDFSEYLTKLNDYFNENNIYFNDDKLNIFFKSLSIDILLKSLGEREEKNLTRLRHQFFNLKKSDLHTLNDWYDIVKKSVKKCEFQDFEEIMFERDRYIYGLDEKSEVFNFIAMKLTESPDLTMNEIHTIASEFEETKMYPTETEDGNLIFPSHSQETTEQPILPTKKRGGRKVRIRQRLAQIYKELNLTGKKNELLQELLVLKAMSNKKFNSDDFDVVYTSLNQSMKKRQQKNQSPKNQQNIPSLLSTPHPPPPLSIPPLISNKILQEPQPPPPPTVSPFSKLLVKNLHGQPMNKLVEEIIINKPIAITSPHPSYPLHSRRPNPPTKPYESYNRNPNNRFQRDHRIRPDHSKDNYLDSNAPPPPPFISSDNNQHRNTVNYMDL